LLDQILIKWVTCHFNS